MKPGITDVSHLRAALVAFVFFLLFTPVLHGQVERIVPRSFFDRMNRIQNIQSILSNLSGAPCYPGSDVSGYDTAYDAHGNVIAHNSATNGGGLAGCDGTIRNNTIVGNAAEDQGGGLLWCYGRIVNCIMWGNRAADGAPFYESSEPTYSCIQGWLVGGEGNIGEDPGLVDPDGPDDDPMTCEDNGCHLASGSQCVDVGRNEAWMSDAVDLDGNPRILNGTVDMGAYEYAPSAFVFEIMGVIRTGGGGLQLRWSSQAGDTYIVWSRSNLIAGEWTQQDTIPSGGETTTWTDAGTGFPCKFYRAQR